MNPDLILNIVFFAAFGGLFAYIIYLAQVRRNLHLGRWKNGVGGIYLWKSDPNGVGVDIFFVPMRQSEIRYAEAHPEEWLQEVDRLRWRIRRVHITWLPWYLVQESPDKFCKGLMNYFEKEADNNGV